MSSIVFGVTDPQPKKCLTCKPGAKPRWHWTGSEYVCLSCYKGNPLVLLYGAGPEDRQCRDCAHLAGIAYAHTVFKCRLRANLTHGAATDQKKTWPACAKFEPREGDIPIYDGRG